MNYIKQLNAFYKLLPNNPLSSNAQCLYNYLLNKNNELGWIKEFTVSNMIVCGFTCLSRQALDRARNELKQKGYIDYKKGISNQAGKYLIVCFDTQDNTQDNTQGDTQGDTQSGHTMSTLTKLKETKLKERKKVSKKDKPKTYDDILSESGLSENIVKSLKDFIQMRTLIKKPMTNRALELCINDLKKLSNDEETQVKIIEQSIKRNWQGLYPLKEQKNDNKNSINVFKNLYEEEGNTWREQTY